MAARLAALLVEDNPDDADVLRETLSEVRAPVNLTTAETMREALDHLAQEEFDVILLDLSLPDSQGLGTVERALAHAPRVPILVLTGLEDEALGAAAVQAGAQDYLIKGRGDGLMLLRCMRYAIERQRLLAMRTADAHIFASMARAGAALLGAPTGPALLERLCSVALAELGCASTAVWILDKNRAAYVPAAAAPASTWQAIAERAVSAATLSPFASNGHANEPVHWLTPSQREVCGPLLPVEPTTGDILCLALTRGNELAGLQLCSFPLGPDRDAVTPRIAQGFVHAATLALSNAQLVDELERSNTIKTYFAATMSHELRGTLFAIGGLG